MSSSALFVRALYDFNSTDSSSLSFKKNDIIQVLTQSETGWWDGLCGGKRGWFPSNYLSDWILQHTPDGELFYYNTKTGDSSWDLPIDDGFLSTSSPQQSFPEHDSPFLDEVINRINGRSNIVIDEEDEDTEEDTEEDTDDDATDKSLNVIKEENDERYIINNHVEKTAKMKENIDDGEESADKESISSSRYTVKQNEKHLYNSSTESIVENVRIMLYASGTIQKDSRIFRENLPLKTYHNQLVTAVSRLVISTKAAVNTAPNTWQSPETMLEKINDVYHAIQQYIQEAENTVKIKRINPKILKNSRVGGGWRGNNILSSAHPSSSTSLTPQLVNSIRQIVSQIGQFLYYVEDLDLRELSEKNYHDSLNDFKVSKQTLYNSIANLAIFTQSAANPLSLPLLNNPLKQVLDYAIVVEKSVNNVIISIKFLVEESEIQIHPSSPSFVLPQPQSSYSQQIHPYQPIQSYQPHPLHFARRRSSAPDAPPTKRRVPHNFVPTINTTINNNVNNYQINEDPSSASSLMMDDDISRESDSPSFALSTTSTINSSYSIPTTAISSSTTTIPKSPVSENPSIITTTSLGSRTFSSFTSRLRSNSSVSTSNTAYDNSSNISLPSSSTSSLQTPTIKTPANSNEQSPPLPDDPKPLHENNPPGEEVLQSSSNQPPTSTSTAPTSPPPSNNNKQEEKLWFLDYDYREIDIIFINESKTTVKGGTLDALIERLTMHDLLDSNFNATFLLTYRSFCDSDTFLEKLIDRFIIKPPEGMTPSEKEIWQEKKQTPIRLRVLSIMKSWLEHYYMDDQDSHCLTRMKEFASTVMSEHMSFASVGLIKIIEKRQFQPGAIFRELINTSPILPPQPILPRNLRRIKFLDLNPLEIARQLTIIESRLYNKIRPVECLNKAWSKEEGGEIAANIKAMIITGWVAEMILNNPDIRRRCALIKHFVAVADKCLLLNNFNSLTAIISGLNSAPIHRLRRTWETASQKTITLLEGLNRVMNSTKNFFAYRETLHSVNPPCVPFLGVYLTDLTFIEDGNPNILKKQTNIINFSKRMKTAEVIREIQQYQSVPYNLTSVQEIQVFIETNLKDSDDGKRR
nr:9157_t:CDS:10 [Entrophospora candida]